MPFWFPVASPSPFSFLKVFVPVPSLFSRVGCFAGGSACRKQGSPLSSGSRVLHFAELFENRFFFACRSLRIRGTGRDPWQDLHEIAFDSAQYPFRCISEESALLLASWLLGFLDVQ